MPEQNICNAQEYEWVAKLPFQEMCWSYSKQKANGTSNVAYYMTTGLGPVKKQACLYDQIEIGKKAYLFPNENLLLGC